MKHRPYAGLSKFPDHMPALIGHIEALYRYPVKSMAGEPLQSATLGWHGLAGDRRLALRRTEDRSGFPWLSASKLPDLVLFAPHRPADAELPTHIRTPDGDLLPAFSDELAAEIARRHGAPVQMMQLKHGIFDDATLSVIATATVDEISRLAAQPPDARRFRPNVVVRLLHPSAFQENNWLGRTLTFGESADAPTISVTMHDIRCSMVNLDPNSAKPTPEVLKAVVRANQNQAGIYATVTRTGQVTVGQPIFLHPATSVSSPQPTAAK